MQEESIPCLGRLERGGEGKGGLWKRLCSEIARCGGCGRVSIWIIIDRWVKGIPQLWLFTFLGSGSLKTEHQGERWVEGKEHLPVGMVPAASAGPEGLCGA